MDHTVLSDGLPDDLRSIRLDDGRRLQPLRLDAMFDRASNWRKSSQAGPSTRAPSPPRKSRVYPLPKAMDAGVEVSPLAGLFEYPELVPQVLKWFDRPAELATIARVNQEFLGIARKQMYASIWIRPWEAQCHDKLDLLFRTLKDQPELCKLVKTLDVRFFPLAIRDTQRYELDEQVQSAVEHMTNLEHLVWTRDKSLNPPLVERMVSLKRLRTLEISGHSHRYYTPTLLGKSTSLDDLRVMMPDSDFGASLVKVVRDLDSRTVGGLRGLAIVARSSPLVDDRMLKEMALHLRALRRLTLWGCTRVTRNGVFDILRQSEDLEELSLDATTHNDLRDLSGSPSLPSLHTLSLSFASPHRTPQHPHLTVADLPVLPREIPCLTSLFLTLSGDRAFLPQGGLDHLSQQVELANLKRLSILNLFIGTTNLESLLSQSSELEELYISVNGRNTVLECKALRGSGLKILHVNAPERWGPDIDDMTDLARIMPALEQIGSGNRVYEINRRYEGDEHVVELCRWSKTYTPGYFQIWRG